MTRKEKEKVEALYKSCALGIYGIKPFSCILCKETVEHKDCKGCPVFCQHHDDDNDDDNRNPTAETLTRWGFVPKKLVKDMTEEELYKLIKFAVNRAKESY